MRILSILAGALFFTSCVVDSEFIDSDFPPVTPPVGMAEVSFEADLPTPKGVATRAIFENTPENYIEDIYVLVFEDKAAGNNTGKLIYKGLGKSLAATDNSTTSKFTFNATLPVGVTYDFMVLANTGNLLNGLSITANPIPTKQDVMDLTRSLSATNAAWPVAWKDGTKTTRTMTPIPMWGELNDENLTTAEPVKFSLIRMMARVNVGTNTTAYGTFRLGSVRVYNYSTTGAVVPASGKYTTDTSTDPVMVTATATTEPDGGYAVPTVTTPRTALLYDSDKITTDAIAKTQIMKDFIYLFETPHNSYTYSAAGNAWIDNPCLVIGGLYDKDGDGDYTDETETFYRVDFIKKATTSGGVDTWLSVLRNFSYNVTITDVSGEGFRTPDEALRSAPFGISAQILAWDERYTQNIIFDGTFYLSIDKDEFLFPRHGVNTKDTENNTNVVKIRTDYLVNKDNTDPNSGWTVDRIDYTSGTGTNWLRLLPGSKPSGWIPGQVNEAYFTFDENTGTTNRTAVVWIRAGRLEYPIYIEQKILSLDIEDKEGEDGEIIEEMVFDIRANGVNVAPTPQDFWVKWNPAAEDVTISMEVPRVGYGFLPTNLSPNPETQNWTIDSGAGIQKYTVSPPMVTSADLLTDAIYDKESTFWFEVQNNGSVERKGVSIHQIYYNVSVDTYGYRLDGGVYTMTVHSNTPWKITKIEERLYNEDPNSPEYTYGDHQLIQDSSYDNLQVGTTGGPHRIGESVSFLTVDDMAERTKFGTVYVRFECVDELNPKFPPIDVPIVFSPESIAILSIGSTIENRAFNPGKSSTQHGYSAYDMFSNYRNFGNFDQSVVKTAPLEFHPHNWIGASVADKPLANWEYYDNYTAHHSDLKNWINEYKPAIITVSYGVNMNLAQVRLLIEYMRNGGVVILYYGASLTDGTTVKRFFDELFGKTFNTSGANQSIDYDTSVTGKVVRIADVDHPIINGPFYPAGLAGQGFGFHEQKMSVRRDMIEDKAIPILYSETDIYNPKNGWTYGFIHRTLPLLWVGNSYGFGTYYEEINEAHHDPLKVDKDTLAPVPNTAYGSTQGNKGQVWTYNSYFAANALAWALRTTSYKHPADNYATFPGI